MLHVQQDSSDGPQENTHKPGLGFTWRFIRTYNPNHKSTYNLLRGLRGLRGGLISTVLIGGYKYPRVWGVRPPQTT